ncbi:MAG: hypothetical protein AAGB26_07275 [Planctomycetota bacterium]
MEAIKAFIRTRWIELIHTEISLSKLEKTEPGTLLWSYGDWFGTSDHAGFFLADLTYLQDTTIAEELKELWAQAIQTDTNLGPASNLAAVYVNQNDFGLDQLDPWYKAPERCEALYNAWPEHQDHGPLGSFFSDARANSELICSA